MDGTDEDIEVKKVNVQKDRVRIVMVIPPRVSVASVIKYMKSLSGKKLKNPPTSVGGFSLSIT